MQELLINGKIKIPENKQHEFIDGFNKLLQDISGEFYNKVINMKMQK